MNSTLLKSALSPLSLLLLSLVVAGCNTHSTTVPEAERAMPVMQQNTYLSHTKPVEKYGFSARRVSDGTVLVAQPHLIPNQQTGITLLKRSLPVVHVLGQKDKTQMYALLDPSAHTSWMEFGRSQNFGSVFLEAGGKPIADRGHFYTGSVPGYAAIVPELRIGAIEAVNSPVYVRMALNSLGPLARGIKVPVIDAVLGYDFLKAFEFVQFDFDAGIVRFSTTTPYSPSEQLLMTTAKIVDVPEFGLAIQGTIMGKPTTVILDVAGDYYFSRGDVTVSTTRQVSLGDVVYRRVPTLLLPENSSPPRAGRKMLEKYVITVCPRAGVVYFERPPE